MTFLSKPRKSRSAKSCSFDASHGVYFRSGANGNSSPGPKTWQCASTLPAGTLKCGLDGVAHQSSQPGVFSNVDISSCCEGRAHLHDAPRTPSDFLTRNVPWAIRSGQPRASFGV